MEKVRILAEKNKDWDFINYIKIGTDGFTLTQSAKESLVPITEKYLEQVMQKLIQKANQNN